LNRKSTPFLPEYISWVHIDANCGCDTRWSLGCWIPYESAWGSKGCWGPVLDLLIWIALLPKDISKKWDTFLSSGNLLNGSLESLWKVKLRRPLQKNNMITSPAVNAPLLLQFA